MKNKTAYMGLFLSFALILSYVESLIPFSFGVPGVKLGLANLAVLLVLYRYGWKEALALNLARVFVRKFVYGDVQSGGGNGQFPGDVPVERSKGVQHNRSQHGGRRMP